MTISKLPFILCALGIGAFCSTVRAQDNPAQAAARAALANQQFGQNVQPATNATAPAAKPAPPMNSKEANAKKTVAASQAKPAAQAAIAAQPVPGSAPAAGDNAAQAAARTALARPPFKTSATPAPVVNNTGVTASESTPATQPASQAAVAAQPVLESAPVTGDNASQAAARMALAQQLFGTSATPSPVVNNTGARAPGSMPATKQATAPPVMVYTTAPAADNNYVGKDLGLRPIAAPPVSISASKQARLQALLERYQTDQITPQQYHQQRAAILAEP